MGSKPLDFIFNTFQLRQRFLNSIEIHSDVCFATIFIPIDWNPAQSDIASRQVAVMPTRNSNSCMVLSR